MVGLGVGLKVMKADAIFSGFCLHGKEENYSPGTSRARGEEEELGKETRKENK